MQEDKKSSLNIKVDVKAINYQNGNVLESQGKLKTVFGGRDAIVEETLSFKGTDCGKATMEANYNSTSQGTFEQATDVELNIKGKILNDKKELIDVVEAESKLSKENAANIGGPKTEDWLKLKLENGCEAKCATTESFYTHRDVATGQASGK